MLAKLAILLRRVESAMLLLLFGAMLAVSAYQVLARNIADSGLVWGDAFVRVMVLWVTVVGALVASRSDSHIRIDLVSHLLTETPRRWLRRASAGFTAVVCLTFAWFGAQFVMYEYQDGIVAFARVPAWVCEMVMPVGFALMGLRYVLHGFDPP